MVHVGLDLSRTRLDVHVMDEAGAPLAVTTAAPDRGGLAVLADRVAGFGGPVYAAIESEQPRVFRTGFLSAFTLLLGFPARRRELPAVCDIRAPSEFS